MIFNIVLQKFLQVLILQTDINRLRMKIDLLSDENSVLGILIFFKYSFLLNIHLIKYYSLFSNQPEQYLLNPRRLKKST